MKNSSQHLIAEVPHRRSRVEMTIGIDLGDVWSHYCKLNEDGEVVDRGRFRTTPKAINDVLTGCGGVFSSDAVSEHRCGGKDLPHC
jgi:transposase